MNKIMINSYDVAVVPTYGAMNKSIMLFCCTGLISKNAG